jgi:hypothetical protein
LQLDECVNSAKVDVEVDDTGSKSAIRTRQMRRQRVQNRWASTVLNAMCFDEIALPANLTCVQVGSTVSGGGIASDSAQVSSLGDDVSQPLVARISKAIS